MSTLYETGANINLFGLGTVTVSPAAAVKAPASRLGDGDISSPHIAGSIAADSYMRVQRNALTNPGFETSTLSGWTDGSLGTGTSAETLVAGEFRSGSKGLKLVGTDASNYGSRYQDIRVRAGQQRRATYYTKGGSADGYIRNLKTGNYLQSDGTWAASRSPWGGQSSVVFIKIEMTYQVESFDACRSDEVYLRWEIARTGSAAYVDDCLDIMGVTLGAIFGHNYGPVSPLVQSSNDGSAWTTRATMTIKRAAFFSTFAIIYAEYWQILLSGTNDVAPYTGEAFLGQYQTSATPVFSAPLKDSDIPASRMGSPISRKSVYNYCVDPRQSVRLTFTAHTAADAREIADSIWLRSAQGMRPTIIIPIDTESAIYYGRLLQPLSEPRPLRDWWQYELMLDGDPFPTVGA